MEGLVEWFLSHGGSLDTSAMTLKHIPNQGRGAIALRDLPTDHTLFAIPRELTLSTRTSELPRLLGEELWKRSGLDKGWSGIILCMMWEEARGDCSKWSTYLRELPTMFDTPIFWSEDDLKELQGCAMVDKLGKQEAEKDYNTKILPLLQNHAEVFEPHLISTTYSLHNYHIMGSRLLSRSFQVEKWEGDGEGKNDVDDGAELSQDNSIELPEPPSNAMVVDGIVEESTDTGNDRELEDSDEEEEEDSTDVAMVPMADMLNARYGSENAKLFHERSCLKMVTTSPIQAGEQIYNTYGDLPNSDLLRRYGHVDLIEMVEPNVLGNPADVVEVPADLISSVIGTAMDQLKERIEWWLDEGGDDVFVLDLETPIPDVLVSFTKTLLLKDNDWEKVRAKSKPPKPKLDDSNAISVILNALQKRLGQYPTSLEKDEEILRSSQIDRDLFRNKKNAIVVRIGEKRILRAAVMKLEHTEAELRGNTGLQQQLNATTANGSGNSKRKRMSNDGKASEKKGRR